MTWTTHNRVIHPICAVLRFVGLRKTAYRFHDAHMPDRIESIIWDHEGVLGLIHGIDWDKEWYAEFMRKKKRK